ncbi:MAG: outer membrane protein assembly factor BamE [Polaromonas sp.]|nr:MAG: outer membrane protein assembly factor BamE [Polaromonas sp.]
MPNLARRPALGSPVLAALVCMACLALTACSSLSSTASTVSPVNWITPFKADVIQGNFVSKEQVGALAVGMSRLQTKDVLGTPLLTSVFHEARWDYVFTLTRQGAEPQAYKYTVFFEGDRLVRFEGDAMPSEAEFLTKLDNKRRLGVVPVLEATEAQLKAAEKPSATAATSTAMPLPAPLTTAYPPLESPRP